MNGQELIDLFDTLTDGLSELSDDGKLALANRKYKKVMGERDWDDARTSTTATITSNAIALASDFKKFVPNEDGVDAEWKNVFYIGTTPYPIVRMAERKKFNGLPYYDPSNSRIVTPDSLEGKTAEYDYYKKVDDLTVDTSPIINNDDHHSIISYMMAVEHYSIDQSENGRTKEGQYQLTADEMMEDMEYDDNQLKNAGINHA